MSTRVEGASPPVILVTAKATFAAGEVCLILTVIEESGNLWRYTLSEPGNSRLAYGRLQGGDLPEKEIDAGYETDHATSHTETTEKLAEPRRRQEVIAEARAGPAAGADDPDDSPDTDGDLEPDARHDHARGELSEPRTRQEVIAEARAGPAAGADDPTDSDADTADFESFADEDGASEEPAGTRACTDVSLQVRADAWFPAETLGDPGTDNIRGDAETKESSSARPDMAARYPADYIPASGPLPRIDGPNDNPESWAADINPDRHAPGRDNNCGECSRAVDNTWNGKPAAAAAMSDSEAHGETVARMTDWAGEAPTPAAMSEILHQLETMGPGSSAVVGCDWKYGGGHWFNAVNDGGTVKAVDGQSGEVETWPPSVHGLGFDERDMRYSDAVFFTADGKVAKK